MRLDRAPVERRDSQPAAAPAVPDLGNFRASTPNFASSLQQQRQKTAAPARESRPANDSATRRTAGREAPEAENRYAMTESETEAVEAPTAFVSAPLLSLFATSGDSSAPAAAASGASRAARRRTTEETPASPCIEVTLPNNGTRFILSQQDGVWILSLQDQPPMSDAELQSMLKELREQFAERGLGEVDVIV